MASKQSVENIQYSNPSEWQNTSHRYSPDYSAYATFVKDTGGVPSMADKIDGMQFQISINPVDRKQTVKTASILVKGVELRAMLALIGQDKVTHEISTSC
tara:strand:- start:4489 stop:4788 length:300 start_codon:yes stop_codon:yes gene_type:complete